MSIASSKRLGGLALATTLLVAACGGGGATTAPASEAATDGGASAPASADAGVGAVTGSINVSCSSTVEPISTGVAEAFAAANPYFT